MAGQSGVGAMETTGHPGTRHAICHQVPFTLGACQSKQKKKLPLKLFKLSGVSALSLPQIHPPTTYSNTSVALHLHPHPLMCPLLYPSVPPFLQWPPLEICCPLSPKVIPIPLLISVASYAIQKNELGRKECHKKELSLTFANQIRFKMARYHERWLLSPTTAMQGESIHSARFNHEWHSWLWCIFLFPKMRESKGN